MDISKHRSEFVIYVVDDEESIQEILKEALGNAGYQTETFGTAEDALARVKESPPHLIFSDIRMPGMSGIELLEKVRELSQEIEYIIMTSHASLETAVHAMKLGAYDYIYKPFENLSDVISTADRTIETIYMRYQNEQLLEELAIKNKQLATVNQKISQENKEIQLVNSLMGKLATVSDPDVVIQCLLTSLSEITENKPMVFLKYLPAYSSLAVSHAVQIPVDGLKSIGINMTEFDPKGVPQILSEPQKFPHLRELMAEVFKLSEFQAVPFIHQKAPVGVIAFFQPSISDGVKRLIDSFLQIAQVSYENAILAARIRDMAIKDPLTGLYNRRFFNDKLEEELSRSRRTHFPVSLIYLDIDNFKHYNDTNGHPMGDVIIKSVAQILQKTGRKTDVVARLGGEEFGIICAMTPAIGAAVKAEKIRLTVESTKFPNGEKQPLGKVSISLGVSEYPTLASDAEHMIRAADDALYKVKQGGRNRVCLVEAPVGFKPDFVPLALPVRGAEPKS